ncbi:cytochrome P450 [Bacillus sp. FJAT-27225]|uniref:cytochrome P450 n=1 Tax=Bacillus sp. FJAT-27225 TaxID=1743144 RepID=UPI00080C2406|nr:cytochrome P450 [Bacillus sp. FJAT-27225]OCA85888.1 cytochrome P450 [Bacillus sp. FJAT-27225]
MSDLETVKNIRLLPGGKLIGGHSKEFRKDPLKFLKKASDFGDVVKIRFSPFQNVYLISEPEMIKEVLVTKHKNFVKSREFAELKTLLGEGLLTSEKETHLHQRRLIQPAFKRSHISNYGIDMIAITSDYISKWRDGEKRVITQDMMDITLGIIAKTMFNLEFKEGSSILGKPFDTVMGVAVKRWRALLKLPLWIPTKTNREHKGALVKINEILFGIIENRRTDPEKHEDMLGILMDARDAEDGNGMTDEQVRDEVMTIFLAGHETTANALSWALYLLSKHPAVQQKLFDEIDRVIGGRNPTPEDFMKLPYTQNVVWESLRIYPPAYIIGREVDEDVEIGGYQFKKGDTILVSQYVMHRKDKYFHDPEAFRPERFENNFLKTIPQFAFFPFGGGPRVCIGNHFAMMEAVLVLATISRSFKVNIGDDHRPAIPYPSITLRPRGGLSMQLEARKNFSGVTDTV